ncbi:MAG: GTPase domain-containing protein [Planctomycetes bacterium]|nr:GTPase domain-containing protein [Planctomycetota bacterium]
MSMSEAAERIRERMLADDSVRVSVALFGQPGCGKSSLINRLTGQQLAAEGVHNDVTTERRDFEWNGLVLVDLPGYDTAMFPADDYLARFGVLDFDLLLCVFDGKFHQADTGLFHAVTRRGKVCLFVRNKHDTLWQDGQELAELEREVADSVAAQVGERHPVHFTSCRLNSGLGELEQAIKAQLEPAKQERWVRAAKAYTQEFLLEKKSLCEQRVTWSAAVAAASGTIPVPGINFAIDLPVLLSLFRFIRDTYGLTDKSLATREFAVPALAPLVNSVVRYASSEGVTLLLKESSGMVIAEQVAKFVPLVGTVIAASLGFAITRKVGNIYLNDCHRLAEAVLKSQIRAA